MDHFASNGIAILLPELQQNLKNPSLELPLWQISTFMSGFFFIHTFKKISLVHLDSPLTSRGQYKWTQKTLPLDGHTTNQRSWDIEQLPGQLLYELLHKARTLPSCDYFGTFCTSKNGCEQEGY